MVQASSTQVGLNCAERRKARRAAERLQAERARALQLRKEKRKREAGMQTCPPDWIVCPWCKQVSLTPVFGPIKLKAFS